MKNVWEEENEKEREIIMKYDYFKDKLNQKKSSIIKRGTKGEEREKSGLK